MGIFFVGKSIRHNLFLGNVGVKLSGGQLCKKSLRKYFVLFLKTEMDRQCWCNFALSHVARHLLSYHVRYEDKEMAVESVMWKQEQKQRQTFSVKQTSRSRRIPSHAISLRESSTVHCTFSQKILMNSVEICCSSTNENTRNFLIRN